MQYRREVNRGRTRGENLENKEFLKKYKPSLMNIKTCITTMEVGFKNGGNAIKGRYKAPPPLQGYQHEQKSSLNQTLSLNVRHSPIRKYS
jgi:hypothetical protein